MLHRYKYRHTPTHGDTRYKHFKDHYIKSNDKLAPTTSVIHITIWSRVFYSIHNFTSVHNYSTFTAATTNNVPTSTTSTIATYFPFSSLGLLHNGHFSSPSCFSLLYIDTIHSLFPYKRKSIYWGTWVSSNTLIDYRGICFTCKVHQYVKITWCIFYLTFPS